MKTFLRRLRGIAVTSVLWGMGWSIAGAACSVAGVAWRIVGGQSGMHASHLPGVAVTGAVFGAIYGMWSGAAFAVILAAAERRRPLRELSVRRMAAWGALGGVALPLLHVGAVVLNAGRMPGDMGIFLAVSAALGAGFAAATLSLVRRGESRVDPPVGTAPGTLPPPNPLDAVPGDAAAVRDRARG